MKRPQVLDDRNGAAAVEFAIIAPFLLLFMLTTIAYGIYLATSHAIQQVAADAARTAVAGYNDQEREQLARDYVKKSTMDYPLIDRKNIAVSVKRDVSNANQFTVVVEYNSKNIPVWGLYTYILPGKIIRKFSTIRIGGT